MPLDSNGGAEISGYTVTSAPDGLTATCLVSPVRRRGPGQRHVVDFTVHATNVAGDSDESGPTV